MRWGTAERWDITAVTINSLQTHMAKLNERGIPLNAIQCYHVVFVSFSYHAGGRCQAVLSIVLPHIKQWPFAIPEITASEMFLFSGSCSNGT